MERQGPSPPRRPERPPEEQRRGPRAWTPTKPNARGAAPLTVGQVLVGAQQFMAKQSGAAMTQEEWRVAVGERVAKNTRVGRLSGGTLVIKVASSAWCTELSFLQDDLLGRLARAGYEIKKLRFQVDAESASKKRPGRPAPRFRGAPPEEPAVLPPELEARLALVEDENLRAAIREAARSSLLAPKKR